MRHRVAAEITTTFASTLHTEMSLAEALTPDALAAYARQATGEKYLVTPNAWTRVAGCFSVTGRRSPAGRGRT